jgi:hypothetical protein
MLREAAVRRQGEADGEAECQPQPHTLFGPFDRSYISVSSDPS